MDAADKQALIKAATELGFQALRVTSAAPVPGAAEDLSCYLAEGRHGDMGWMEGTAERRASPQALWADAKSVIMLGTNYGPGGDPLTLLARPDRGYVSVYARGDDYHDVMKRRLRRLAEWLVAHHGGDVKLFVDTAPVMEKPLAGRAGLGWQGRHTNLVSRDFGSWLFLGSLFTTLDIPADEPESDHCGSCRACESVCPTGALSGGRIDPRLCISYLTIEHKGTIPRALRPALGNRIYGCDDCLAVCPWNKFGQLGDPALAARAELQAPRLADLVQLDDAGFRAVFSKSPIKRLGLARFLRNVLIAIGNSGDEKLGEAAEARLTDPDPRVRAMAVWAARRLMPAGRAQELATRYAPVESDPTVLAEWRG